MANRTVNFCPKCFESYTKIQHLKICYEDEDLDRVRLEEIHESQRAEVMASTQHRVVSEDTVLEKARESGLADYQLPEACRLLEVLGHKVVHKHAEQDAEENDVRAALEEELGEEDMAELQEAFRAGVQSAAHDLRPRPQRDGSGTSDFDSDSDRAESTADDEVLDRSVNHCGVLTRQKMATKNFVYANDPLRRNMVRLGLYATFENPEDDPVLIQYAEHLTTTLNKKGRKYEQDVKRVSRFFYYMQKRLNPDETPSRVDLVILENRRDFVEYSKKLNEAGMTAAGKLNYMWALKHFLKFIAATTNVDAEKHHARDYLDFLEIHLKSSGHVAYVDSSDKKFQRMVDPDFATPPLEVVCEAYTSPKICIKVMDLISKGRKQNRRAAVFVRLPGDEELFVMRYLAGAMFQLCHSQRPGVSEHMKMAEFSRVRHINAHHVVCVREHKTSVKYPACLALSGEDYQMMEGYLEHVRGTQQGDDCPETSHFFRNKEGKGGITMSKELSRFQSNLGMIVRQTKAGGTCYTARDARKAMETKSNIVFADDPKKTKQINDYLAHSDDVSKKSYVEKKYPEVVMAKLLMDKVRKAVIPSEQQDVYDPRPIVPGGSSQTAESVHAPDSDMVSVLSMESLASVDSLRDLDYRMRSVFFKKFPAAIGKTAPYRKDVTPLLINHGVPAQFLTTLCQRFQSAFRYQSAVLEVKAAMDERFQKKPTEQDVTQLLRELNLKCSIKPTTVQRFWREKIGGRRLVQEKEARMQRETLTLERIDSQDWPGLVINEMGDRGKGVVTLKTFQQGDTMMDYGGLHLSGPEAEVYIDTAEKTLLDTSYQFLFKYDGIQHVVDAMDVKEYGNKVGRYVNHSRRHPNLIPKVKVLDGNVLLLLVASRDIMVNEELLFNYADNRKNVPEWMKQKACPCKKCSPTHTLTVEVEYGDPDSSIHTVAVEVLDPRPGYADEPEGVVLEAGQGDDQETVPLVPEVPAARVQPVLVVAAAAATSRVQPGVADMDNSIVAISSSSSESGQEAAPKPAKRRRKQQLSASKERPRKTNKPHFGPKPKGSAAPKSVDSKLINLSASGKKLASNNEATTKQPTKAFIGKMTGKRNR